ncbi:MAG: metallophosphoesterase family protein [Candidatus Hermodarchaeia archaeon]
MKILSISDKIVSFIYSPQVKIKFGHVDFVIACGDLPYYYQEFIVSSLDVPLFFVRGNHDPEMEIGEIKSRPHPYGAIDLHRRVIHHNGVLIAGVEGSIRYKKEGSFQYTQSQMWNNIMRLVPMLLVNRLVHGRYLDIFVTHAPPWKIHDKEDRPHQGIKAFRWFLQVFKPRYHFHGHTHVYRPDTIIKTDFHDTQVINSYGFLETELQLGD